MIQLIADKCDKVWSGCTQLPCVDFSLDYIWSSMSETRKKRIFGNFVKSCNRSDTRALWSSLSRLIYFNGFFCLYFFPYRLILPAEHCCYLSAHSSHFRNVKLLIIIIMTDNRSEFIEKWGRERDIVARGIGQLSALSCLIALSAHSTYPNWVLDTYFPPPPLLIPRPRELVRELR